MARAKKHPEHENHERWLVSYADFITLLFAFFVVMFATSQVDKGKAQQVSDGVKKALEGDKITAMVAAMINGPTKEKPGQDRINVPDTAEPTTREQQQIAELLPSLRLLSSELSEEIRQGKIQLTMTDRGLSISFAQTALFPSGEDFISADAHESIGKVAAAIVRLPNPVRLEGHTDARPISTPRFHSNWDLSSARSIALLKILTERFGVPPGKLSVAGLRGTRRPSPRTTAKKAEGAIAASTSLS